MWVGGLAVILSHDIKRGQSQLAFFDALSFWVMKDMEK